MQIEAGPRVRGPPHTPHHSPLGPSQSQGEPPGHNATVTPVTPVTSVTPSTAAVGASQTEGPPGGGLTPLPWGAPSNGPRGTGALGGLLGGGRLELHQEGQGGSEIRRFLIKLLLPSSSKPFTKRKHL